METNTRIRQVRIDRGLSIRQVAEAAGIPRSILQRLETGEGAINRPMARRLYKFYDYEVDLGDIYDPTFDAEVAGAA